MKKIASIPNSTIGYLIDIGDATVATIEAASSVQSLRAIGDARGEVALIIDDAAQELAGLLFAWEHQVDQESAAESISTLRTIANDIKSVEQIIASEQERFGVNDETLDDAHRDRRHSAAIAISEMIEKIQEAR